MCGVEEELDKWKEEKFLWQVHGGEERCFLLERSIVYLSVREDARMLDWLFVEGWRRVSFVGRVCVDDRDFV